MGEKVFKRFSMQMSTKKMSAVMYAIIMTGAKLTSSYGVGIYSYTRQQNAYNRVEIMIEILEDKIQQFEEMTEICLINPQTPKLN